MPESTGVLGDGSHHAGKGNMALVRRAIRHNWPVSAAIKQKIVDQMETIATAGESERDRIAAAKDDIVGVLRELVQAVADSPNRFVCSSRYVARAHRVLRDAAAQLYGHSELSLQFDGFIEADKINRGDVDVVVTDGFSGNIAPMAGAGQ